MYRQKTFVAVIPARGGSKGIPHKNIAAINGKPLLEYTINAAKRSKYIDDIIVTTDDSDIRSVAESNGVMVVQRPKEIASDTSKTIDAVIHVLSVIDKKFDHVVLLQPTQPLRQSFHIDNAIKEMIDNDHDSVVSISPVKDHPVLIRKKDDDNRLTSLLDTGSTVRRQDFDAYYVVNGAIYINKVSEINKNSSFNDNEYGYVMEEEYDWDIDTPLDLFICEKLLQRIKPENEEV